MPCHCQVGRVMVSFGLNEVSVERRQLGIEITDRPGEDLELFAASPLDERTGNKMIDDLLAPPFADCAHQPCDPRTADGWAERNAAFAKQLQDASKMLQLLDGDRIELIHVSGQFHI